MNEYTDKLWENLSDKQKREYMEIFRQCSIHELHFWQMSGKPREDV